MYTKTIQIYEFITGLMRIYAEFTHQLVHLHTSWFVFYVYYAILMAVVRHYASTVRQRRTSKWLI